jgi:large subunit ribosomal protein L14
MLAGSNPARSTFLIMLIPGSLIDIVDNTGVKIVRCIKILNSSPKTKIGDLVIVSLRKVKLRYSHKGQKKEQFKQGEIRLVLLISLIGTIYRKDGTRIKIIKNYGVIVNTKGKILGSRFQKAIPKEIRSQKWIKLLSMTPLIF